MRRSAKQRKRKRYVYCQLRYVRYRRHYVRREFAAGYAP